MISPRSFTSSKTETPIWRMIGDVLQMAWPLILASILQRLFFLVDAFWIGRLGAGAINASAAAVQINTIIFFAGFAFSNGFIIPASKAMARDDKTVLEDLFRASIFSILAFSLVAVGIVLLFAPLILAGMSLNDSAGDAAQFLRIVSIGIPGTLLFNVLSRKASMEKQGALLPVIKLASLMLNFILDPLLMLGFATVPAFGVSGVALATVICKYGALAWLWMSMNKKVSLSIPRLREFGLIARNGWPVAATEVLRGLFFSSVIGGMTSFGTDRLAAFNVSTQIIGLSAFILAGCETAVASHLTRTADGDHLSARAIVAAMMTTSGMMMTLFLPVVLFPEVALRFFCSEAHLLAAAEGTLFLRLPAVAGIAFSCVALAACRAIEMPRLGLIASAASHGAMWLMVIASKGYSETGLIAAAVTAPWIEAILASSILMFRFKPKKEFFKRSEVRKAVFGENTL